MRHPVTPFKSKDKRRVYSDNSKAIFCRGGGVGGKLKNKSKQSPLSTDSFEKSLFTAALSACAHTSDYPMSTSTCGSSTKTSQTLCARLIQ